MPKRAVHDIVGIAAGISTSVVRASDQQTASQLLEGFGAGFGGLIGSRLPDVIDPPLSPNHRDIAHAVLPVAGLFAAGWDLLNKSQGWLRTTADAEAVKRVSSNSMTDFERFVSWAKEILCRILAGMLDGIAGGYISHLVLDAGSARGLPLLAQGL